MYDAPIGTTSWSPAKKWNGLKKLTYSGGRGGIVTLFQTIQFSMGHLCAHSLNVKQFCLTLLGATSRGRYIFLNSEEN